MRILRTIIPLAALMLVAAAPAAASHNGTPAPASVVEAAATPEPAAPAPAEDATAAPSEDPTTAPSADDVAAAGGDETAAPGDHAAVPPDEDGDEIAAPDADEIATPGDDQTAVPGDDQAAAPDDDTAAASAGDATPSQPGGGEDQATLGEQVAGTDQVAAAVGPAPSAAVNVSETIQQIWQVQLGCVSYCDHTSQQQLASQGASTQQSAAAGGALNGASVLQDILQLQIGCLFNCVATVQQQVAEQVAMTVQRAVAGSPEDVDPLADAEFEQIALGLGDALTSAMANAFTVLTTVNGSLISQRILQLQLGCERGCQDVTQVQASAQRAQTDQDAEAGGLLDELLAWLRVLLTGGTSATNTSTTSQRIEQLQASDCRSHCTDIVQLQVALQWATTMQTAAAGPAPVGAPGDSPPAAPVAAPAGGDPPPATSRDEAVANLRAPRNRGRAALRPVPEARHEAFRATPRPRDELGAVEVTGLVAAAPAVASRLVAFATAPRTGAPRQHGRHRSVPAAVAKPAAPARPESGGFLVALVIVIGAAGLAALAVMHRTSAS